MPSETVNSIMAGLKYAPCDRYTFPEWLPVDDVKIQDSELISEYFSRIVPSNRQDCFLTKNCVVFLIAYKDQARAKIDRFSITCIFSRDINDIDLHTKNMVYMRFDHDVYNSGDIYSHHAPHLHIQFQKDNEKVDYDLRIPFVQDNETLIYKVIDYMHRESNYSDWIQSSITSAEQFDFMVNDSIADILTRKGDGEDIGCLLLRDAELSTHFQNFNSALHRVMLEYSPQINEDIQRVSTLINLKIDV